MDNQCTATAKSTGEQCQRPAIKGSNVCYQHGGAAEQVQQKAQERLDEMADSATAEMQARLSGVFERLDSPELSHGEYVSLLREARQLTTDILDRTGHGPTESREVEDVTDGSDGFGTTIVLDSEYVDDE